MNEGAYFYRLAASDFDYFILLFPSFSRYLRYHYKLSLHTAKNLIITMTAKPKPLFNGTNLGHQFLLFDKIFPASNPYHLLVCFNYLCIQIDSLQHNMPMNSLSTTTVQDEIQVSLIFGFQRRYFKAVSLTSFFTFISNT